MPRTFWLNPFLRSAVQRRLCTICYCATCESRPFKDELFRLASVSSGRPDARVLDQGIADELVDQLSVLTREADPFDVADPVRLIFCMIWDSIGERTAEERYVATLQGTWAGELLASMRKHEARLAEVRFQRTFFESAEQTKLRKDQKRHQRQEAHTIRLRLKKERDRLWHQRDLGNKA